MKNMTSALLAALLAAGLGIAGCGENGTDADHDHDHAHGEGDHDHDHEHAEDGSHEGDEDHADHDEDMAHSGMRPIGQITLTGGTLDVEVAGDLTPGSEMHVNITYADGEPPSAVRVWVGVESAEGSMKAKADAGDEGYHAHVEVPDPLPADSRLWLEAEDESGEREQASLVVGEG